MGLSGKQLNLSGIPEYMIPCYRADGSWASAGALAIRESLSRGSMPGVLDVLESMDAPGMAKTLRETGFFVSQGAVEKGCEAVLASVQHDLIKATEMRVDGFGLDEGSFAAKEWVGDDITAVEMIQRVMRAKSVSVNLLGNAAPDKRGSLIFVAGQALQNGVQGFGFEGVPGKYEVPLSMLDVVGLHREAARSVAEESVRTALEAWSQGEKVSEVSEWVPDSVQRLLNGSLSVSAASALVNAIEGGMVGKHAREVGVHEFARLLSEQGFDVNAPTIDQQADQLGLTMTQPDRNRGIYVGPMVGQDHRAGLVKYAREKAVELPFEELAKNQSKPRLGETVKMKFEANKLAVSVVEKSGHEPGR